jgi:hypothetical protein
VTADVERKRAVRCYHDIKLARAMLGVMASDITEYHRSKSNDFEQSISELRNQLQQMRRAQRPVERLTRAAYAKTEISRISADLGSLFRGWACSPNLAISKSEPDAKSRNGRRAATVDIRVGYLWHRRIWETIHKDKRMVTPNTVVLTATEYRTNVQHIRLYEVSAYNVISGRMSRGWVGQTKLGKQACVFVKDKTLAITEALKLTTKAIDSQVKGEIS